MSFAGVFWMVSFVQASADFTVIGAVADWYFVKGHIGPTPLASALGEFGRRHIGTAAFGSVIIAFCRMMRATVGMLRRQCGATNCCAKFMMSCCACCMSCMQDYLETLSRIVFVVVCK